MKRAFFSIAVLSLILISAGVAFAQTPEPQPPGQQPPASDPAVPPVPQPIDPNQESQPPGNEVPGQVPPQQEPPRDAVAPRHPTTTDQPITGQPPPTAHHEPGQLGATLTDTPEGVYVSSVFTNGPAFQSGIQSGDLLVRIDGQPVRGFMDVRNLITAKLPGDTVTIEFFRQGQPMTETATLVSRRDLVHGASNQFGHVGAGQFDQRVLRPSFDRLPGGPMGIDQIQQRVDQLEVEIRELKRQLEMMRQATEPTEEPNRPIDPLDQREGAEPSGDIRDN